jgi:hypothetical protein
MHIFIDESGVFQCTNQAAAPCCVGAVTIPGRHYSQIEDGFRQLTVDWPGDNSEIKGKRLSETHFAQLCEFLEPYGVLFECSVMDMAGSPREKQAITVLGKRKG